MKANSMAKRWFIMLLTAALFFSSFTFVAYGEEVSAEDGGGEAAPEMTEEEIQAAAEAAQAALETVVPSSIETNISGKYLALSFPASEVPKGFTVRTIEYGGEEVRLAEMTSKSATIGAEGYTVTLAYLTDADGSNGEFYICDTTNDAKMSDMIKIEGPGDSYIIVLDPGDNVVGPNGFKKQKLQWGKKTASAWSLPEGGSSEEDEEKSDKEDKDKEEEKEKEADEKDKEENSEDSSASIIDSLFVTRVYADDFIGAGAGAALPDDSSSDTDDTAEESGSEDASNDNKEDSPSDKSADDDAMLALEEIAHTNASGLIQAQPKDFCLLFAIDDGGNLGFYLYDIQRSTYQRYVEIDSGESATTIKYRKLSRTRLLIIVILAILLVVFIFLFINTLLSKKRRDESSPDEEEAMRERAIRKERARIRVGRRELNYLMDRDEEEEEENYAEEDYSEDNIEDNDNDGGGSYDYGDEEEDIEEPEYREEAPVRRKKAKKSLFLEKKPRPEKEKAIKPVQKLVREDALRRNDDEDDDITIYKGRKTAADTAKPVRTEKRGSRVAKNIEDERRTVRTEKKIEAKKRPDYDLDEDFDFEFLNIKK